MNELAAELSAKVSLNAHLQEHLSVMHSVSALSEQIERAVRMIEESHVLWQRRFCRRQPTPGGRVHGTVRQGSKTTPWSRAFNRHIGFDVHRQ